MNTKKDSAKAIRLLIVHAQDTSKDCGGSFGILCQFLKGIDHKRFDVQVVLSFLHERQVEPDSTAVRLVRDCGLKLHMLIVPMNQMSTNVVVLMKYFTDLIFSTWKLFRLVRREGIEIVYTNSTNILASGIAARLAGVKSIYHIHEIVCKPRLVAKTLLRVIGALADTLICVTEAAKILFLEVGVDASKLVKVSNCIDLDVFSKSNTGKSVRKEFAPKGDEKLIASVGRVVSKKGHHYVIQAAKKIVDKYPSSRFLIVGAGRTEEDNYMEHLINQVKESGLERNVFFTGLREDIPEIMAAVDVVVLASSSDYTPEASPLVVLEALAMGTPVVASDLGGIPEILHHGKTGYLVPPRNSDALANAILKLLQQEQLAREMGRTGQSLVRNNFSASEYSIKIQNVVLESL